MIGGTVFRDGQSTFAGRGSGRRHGYKACRRANKQRRSLGLITDYEWKIMSRGGEVTATEKHGRAAWRRRMDREHIREQVAFMNDTLTRVQAACTIVLVDTIKQIVSDDKQVVLTATIRASIDAIVGRAIDQYVEDAATEQMSDAHLSEKMRESIGSLLKAAIDTGRPS